MALRDALLAEWDHEMAGTRKVLANIPDGKHDWTPHAKSWSAGKLGTHVATMGMWAHLTCTQDSFDLAGSPKTPEPANTADLLRYHDEWAAKGRAAIAATDDAAMMQPWSLRMGDHVIFTMPRVAVLRSFVFSHMIHHRGQLTVYLKSLGVPIPSIYGPSADENPFA